MTTKVVIVVFISGRINHFKFLKIMREFMKILVNFALTVRKVDEL